VHGGRLHTYYIRPAAQLMRLRRYFRDVTIYSLTTGAALAPGTPLDEVDDPWLYYLCRIRK
jgi:hypothetical protein